MTKRRKPIPLQQDEDRLLRQLYVQWRIPRGQLKQHPDYLAEFVRVWNRLSGRSDTDVDVLHYIDTKQKQTKRLSVPWPVFKGAHKRLQSVATVLGPSEMDVLRTLYLEIVVPENVGTEGLIYQEEILRLLSMEFAARTGFGVPGMLLAARIEAERKQGSWFTLRDHGTSGDDEGFNDLDEIATA